jgi:hypothetical protein
MVEGWAKVEIGDIFNISLSATFGARLCEIRKMSHTGSNYISWQFENMFWFDPS